MKKAIQFSKLRLKRTLSYFVILLLFVQTAAHAQATRHAETIQLPVEVVIDKIRGGMLGQILGNLNGLPHEFKYIKEPGQVKNYVPELLSGAHTDDDTDFEWVYIIEMQKERNIYLPYDEIYALWNERINRRIWCANRYARHLMDLELKPPLTGNVLLNPWADFNISGQFLCETFGLLAPAMPQTAAKIGLHYTKVAIDGEPAQTTQLFTTMIAMAYTTSDINRVIDAGIAALDPASKMLQVANDMKQWYAQYPSDWQMARKLLREKYTQESDKIRDTNGSELNTGSIFGALLYGQGDFSETLKVAFNFGWDADNNAAQVGTIIGVMDGYRKMLANGWRIVDRYENTTRDNMPMDETITSFSDRLIELFEVVNTANGGSKLISTEGVPVYEINVEQPASVLKIGIGDDVKNTIFEHESQEVLITKLRTGSKVERARAAYIAVCLDLYPEIKKKHPREWAAAKEALSGYVKVMNNIFHGGDFKSLDALQQKFVAAGFTAPNKRLSDSEVYSEVTWKDPKDLY